uniref:RNA-directed DNA polymerase n=1 Tax=Phlebotomus papatasi TaxID=29031 RepID=A0A1B0DI97_PHLPP
MAIGGITEGVVKTLGTVSLRMGFTSFDHQDVLALLHVLPNRPFPFDGIIGRDLLSALDAVIHVNQRLVLFNKLQIAVPFIPFSLDQHRLQDEFNSNSPGQNNLSKSHAKSDPLLSPEFDDSPQNQSSTHDKTNEPTERISSQNADSDQIQLRPNSETYVEFAFPHNEPQVKVHLNKIIRLQDPEKINNIIKEFHNSPLHGHKGVTATSAKIKQKFFFKNMNRTIAKFIERCDDCQKNKISRHTKMPMMITSTPPSAFYRVTMDVVGPLALTESGNKYLLTIYDELTKYLVAIPMANQTAESVADAFVDKFICIFGTPIEICSDQGACFTSDVFKRMCKLLHITKTQATPFHPQTSGGVERSHRTLAEYLRIFTQNGRSDWDKWIPKAVAAYNSSQHHSHNFTPHELIFGEKYDISSFSHPTNDPVYTFDDFITDLKRKLQTTQHTAAEMLKTKKEKSKNYYDTKLNPVQFKVGDKVLLINKSLPKAGESSKLLSKRKGPYTVTKIVSPLNTTIQIGKSEKTYHNNLLKLYVE